MSHTLRDSYSLSPGNTFHTNFKEQICKTMTQREMFPLIHTKEECFTLSPQNSVHLKPQSDFYSRVRLQILVSCD